MGKDFDLWDFFPEDYDPESDKKHSLRMAKYRVDIIIEDLKKLGTPQKLIIQKLEKELENPKGFNDEFINRVKKEYELDDWDRTSEQERWLKSILENEQRYKNELYKKIRELKGEEETRKQEGNAKEIFHLLNELGMLKPLLEYCEYDTGTKVEAEKKVTKIFNKITGFEISPAATKDYIRIAKKEGDRKFSKTIKEAVSEFLQNL